MTDILSTPVSTNQLSAEALDSDECSGGHLHDGGTALQLLKNDEIVCDSKPTYGRLPGANPESPETIVGMSWCYDSIRIKKGDLLTLKTFYDTDLHPLYVFQ